MADLPYMPFWVSKYLGKTSRLSTEQHGAYLLILFAMWQDGGQLPNNEKTLARVAGVSLRKWRSISPEIMRLLDVEGEFVTQDRLKKEHLRLLLVSQKRSASGRKGVEAKALKNKGQGSANGSANRQAKPKQRLSIPDPDPEIKDTSLRSVSKNSPEILDENNNVIPLKASQPSTRKPDDRFPMSLQWIPPAECSDMARLELNMNKDQYCDARGEFVEYWSSQSRTKKGKKSADGWKRTFNSSLRRCAKAWGTESNYRNTSRKTGGIVENMRVEVQRGGASSDWF